MAHAEGINANGSTHNGLQHAILSGMSTGPETKRAWVMSVSLSAECFRQIEPRTLEGRRGSN